MDATATDALAPERQDTTDDLGLVRICGKGAPRVVSLTRGATVVFGRDAGASSVSVDQPGVSRVHARIERRGGVVVVTDLGSKNGTFVNGRTVAECPLQEGDCLRLGQVVYMLVRHASLVADGCERGPVARFGLVGGHRFETTLQLLEVAARSELAVLITGESGTGKELAARALHDRSGRRGSFCAINCAAIAPHLFESELFGYRRGAFTGADRDHPGLFRAAANGTVFLDEIGDMPLELQAKLLRVLESREVLPLGAVRPEHVDIRVVSATHRNLRQRVADGEFRGDLLARLASFSLELPPLRDRREDIEMLVRHYAAQPGEGPREVTDAAMVALVTYDWPYNVRELSAAVRRAMAAAPGPIGVDHLPAAVVEGAPAPHSASLREAAPPPSVRRSPDKQRPSTSALVALLIQHRGNVAAMARSMGKDRAQVHRWLRDANVDVDEHRR